MDRSERFYRIRQTLGNNRRGASLAALVTLLEVSPATVKRDIQYLRDRFNVPILWDRDTNSYRLDPSAGVELPGLWLDPEELGALLAMEQLLESLHPGLLETYLGPIRKRLTSLALANGKTLDSLRQHFRILAAAPRRGDLANLRLVARAIVERRRLVIEHYHRIRDERIRREVSPHHLTYYRGAWYAGAWCHLREDLRVFSLDAIERVEVRDQPIRTVDSAQWDAAIRASYGIFTGPVQHWAVIRFSPERARWVAAEQWHPDQKAAFDHDGSYVLQVPYSDDRELVMDILRHGPDAEVLEPPSLRGRVGDLHAEAASRYAGVGG